jgi:hypothetical protein
VISDINSTSFWTEEWRHLNAYGREEEEREERRREGRGGEEREEREEEQTGDPLLSPG